METTYKFEILHALRTTGKGARALLIITALLFLFAPGTTANTGRGAPKVVIVEIHGMMRGVLDQDLENLPHFQEVLKGASNDQGYVYLPNVLTTVPAASQPAVTSMYTGIYPKRTGVVSTIWFDRYDHQIHTLISYSQQRINHILAANQVKSLFDYVNEAGKHSMTAMLMLTKGAEWSLRSGAHFWGNASVLGFLRNGHWIPDSSYVDDRTMDALTTGHMFAYRDSLKGVYRRQGALPDVMVVQLLGMDLFSHFPVWDPNEWTIPIGKLQKYYTRTVLDPLVGRLTATFKDLGCYDDTLFVFVSEHGLTRITRRIPNNIVDRCLRGQFDLPGWSRNNAQAEAIIMPGAGTKDIYLKNRESRNWADPPRLLADVKPAVDLLLGDPEVQTAITTLVIRQYPGERSEGVAENGEWWVFDWKDYLVGTRDHRAFLSALRPLSQLTVDFELGAHLVTGLTNQYTRPTAPDIKLINKRGVYFEDDANKYAHHGSFYPDDCVVSFWVGGPGLRQIITGRHVLEQTASTLDLVPMVTYLLGMPHSSGLDGRNPLAGLDKEDGKPLMKDKLSPTSGPKMPQFFDGIFQGDDRVRVKDAGAPMDPTH